MEHEITPFIGMGQSTFFGMSAEQVEAAMGKAQSKTTGGGDIIEVRDNITYVYDCTDTESELICCTASLQAPFFFDGERVPFTQLEAISFFKKRSKMNMRFPLQSAYVFCDCGIVLYLYKEVDIRAGSKVSTHTMRLAVCDKNTLAKYTKYFLKNEKVDNSDWFTSHFGVTMEQFTNLNEEELKTLTDGVDEFSYDDREAL